ncbi:MAG TPA: hypothetical protein VNF51_01725 [Candidatus Paceibacterota bacterium]|nr:hypothetical protein [Candidatus Paceibacterota bacterium]
MNKEKEFALLRIATGLVWAADAAFKWAPQIRLHIVEVLTQTQAGQSAFESSWIQFWVHVANVNPILFGTGIALVETALSISLITGVFSRAALYCGVVFAFLIWSVPQGFGAPYVAGNTDIDSGIVYLLLFVALILGQSWRRYNMANLFFGDR